MTTNCKAELPEFCTDYYELMDSHPEEFCKDQWKLRRHIEHAFQMEDLIVEIDRYRHYVSLGSYLGFGDGYEWERYIIGLFLCVYYTDPDGNVLPRWSDCLALMGRGAGKDGLISWISLCLISPYNPVPSYDVDICAYNEDQSKRPFTDVWTALEDNPKKFQKHFYWTRELIQGKRNGGAIRYHANNAKGKDGLRSGIIILNEVHVYENTETIDVFTTGLGKKAEPRLLYATTNGNVIDGPLDDLMKDAEKVLDGDEPDGGFLPVIYRVDSKDERHDEIAWRKANPSLRYTPSLMTEYRREYRKWSKNPKLLPAFSTKRMGWRQSSEQMPVAEWEDIAATEQDIPDLSGWDCVVGIDFGSINDWAAINLHFKGPDESRYDLNHAWICQRSDQLWRLKCPYEQWAEEGLVSLVDDVEIDPALLTEWIADATTKYSVRGVCLDSYKYSLLRDGLESIGFTHKKGNLKLYRPSDVMQIVPVVDRLFKKRLFHWGDNPVLRWATNNAKLIPAKRSTLAKSGEADFGNYLIGKIEPLARKTDPLMALVASLVIEDKLRPPVSQNRRRVKVKTF